MTSNAINYDRALAEQDKAKASLIEAENERSMLPWRKATSVISSLGSLLNGSSGISKFLSLGSDRMRAQAQNKIGDAYASNARTRRSEFNWKKQRMNDHDNNHGTVKQVQSRLGDILK